MSRWTVSGLVVGVLAVGSVLSPVSAVAQDEGGSKPAVSSNAAVKDLLVSQGRVEAKIALTSGGVVPSVAWAKHRVQDTGNTETEYVPVSENTYCLSNGRQWWVEGGSQDAVRASAEKMATGEGVCASGARTLLLRDARAETRSLVKNMAAAAESFFVDNRGFRSMTKDDLYRWGFVESPGYVTGVYTVPRKEVWGDYGYCVYAHPENTALAANARAWYSSGSGVHTSSAQPTEGPCASVVLDDSTSGAGDESGSDFDPFTYTGAGFQGVGKAAALALMTADIRHNLKTVREHERVSGGVPTRLGLRQTGVTLTGYARVDASRFCLVARNVRATGTGELMWAGTGIRGVKLETYRAMRSSKTACGAFLKSGKDFSSIKEY
jgi:hypothetical protein